MIKLNRLLTAVVCLAIVPAVYAESLEEKKEHERQVKNIQTKLKSMNAQCKTSMTFEFDWSTWKTPSDGKGHEAFVNCGGVLEEIDRMCHDKDAQEAIAKAITAVTCKGDGDTAKLELSGKTLVVHTALDGKHSNAGGKVTRDYLMKNLK